MAKRAQLNPEALAPKPARPRPTIDRAALYPKGWNGWERQDGAEGSFYPIYLCCYTARGHLQERHGFHDEDVALQFAQVHGAPGQASD